MVNQRMVQLRGGSIDDDVLVDFDVGHRGVLVFEAAFKTAATFAEQRQLPEASIAMAKYSCRENTFEGEWNSRRRRGF